MTDFEKTGHRTPRRVKAGFSEGMQPPIIGEPWRKLSIRERFTVWSEASANDINMPYIVYFLVCFKLVLWAAFYRYAVMDRDQSVFADVNVKRFILYNVIGDVTGTNSTWGILGMRMHHPFVTWWNFITPGTLTVPLIPGFTPLRSKPLVGLYLAYLAALVYAMLQPVIGFEQMALPLALLAVMLPQDFNIFMACRGSHYVPFMVCCLMPKEQCLFGWQVVQLALWTWAGVSKLGPWFKYVTAAMFPNTVVLKFLPFNAVSLIHVSETDPSPTALCGILSHFGTVTELCMGAACVYYPAIGVPLTISFHLYIFSMFPFASVMEWNILCISFCYYLFFENTMVVPELHPVFAAYLFFVAFVLPFFGNLFPKHIPFLLAMRPYAGNWKFSFTVVKKTATDKLKKIKSLSSPIVKEQVPAGGNKDPDTAEQWEYSVSATHLVYPHYRPFLPMLETLAKDNKWGPDDFHYLQQEGFLNAIYGWSLGQGFYIRDSHFRGIQEVCGFKKGECYTMVVEPHSLFSRTSEWWCVDNAEPDKKVIHGKCSYQQLEDWGPLGMPASAVNNQGKKRN